MIRLSAAARAQVAQLTGHYTDKGRDNAIRNLRRSLTAASDRIEAGKGPFFPAPRPYPSLTRLGWQWLKAGSYWIAFGEVGSVLVIRAVFHESANIPARMPR